VLFASVLAPAWLAGTAMLATAKILENMEIGHNVLHGQWDWMRDAQIHSTTWEWDSASPAAQWKHSHNYVHHTWTNVLGKDRDIGYSALRVHPEQPWHPIYLAQPLYNAVLAAFFEYGIAIYDVELERVWRDEKSWREALPQLRSFLAKTGRQATKDYLAFPLLAGPSVLPCCWQTSSPISPATCGRTRSFSADTSRTGLRSSPGSRSRARPAGNGICGNCSAPVILMASRCSTS
jgi:linoleoyl-CoA desaturase